MYAIRSYYVELISAEGFYDRVFAKTDKLVSGLRNVSVSVCLVYWRGVSPIMSTPPDFSST